MYGVFRGHMEFSKKRINASFSSFAKYLSKLMGSSFTFIVAFLAIILWLAWGPYFQYSDTWELVINTTTSIITFLMVFLLQHTQNRDTLAMHLKLDEIIRSMSTTHNELLKSEQLSDEELEKMSLVYEELAKNIKERIKKGETIEKSPKIIIKNDQDLELK